MQFLLSASVYLAREVWTTEFEDVEIFRQSEKAAFDNSDGLRNLLTGLSIKGRKKCGL